MIQSRAPAQVVLKRTFAAAAQPNVRADEASGSGAKPKYGELKVTRLPNGLMVGSMDTNRAVSRLGILFRAGSRYENGSAEAGLVHRLRNCVGLGTQKSTQINVLYRAGRIGSDLRAVTTRDLFMVQMNTLRDNAADALPVLGETANLPGFKWWELEETSDIMNLEIAQLKENPEKYIMEVLHKAAYRSGPLSHSLYAPKRLIGKHNPQTLHKFVSNHLLSSEAALFGLDVDHELLLQYATDALPIASGQSVKVPASPYFGGELRKEKGGLLSHAIVAGEGAHAQDGKGLATQAVLGAVVGTGPRLPYGSSGMGLGRSAQAAGKAAGHGAFGVSAVSVAHVDSGLFGIYVVAQAQSARDVIKAALQPLNDIAQSGIDEKELHRAKAIAKADLLLRIESGDGIFEDLASQTLLGGATVHTPDELLTLLDGVNAKDVQQVARKVIGGKPTMAAVGNLDNTPYLDEIF